MKPIGYLIFHINLGFSSIEEKNWLSLIDKCYHPLLDFVERTGIPVGVELTGWTLKKIQNIDISWVERLKKLLKDDKCQLIGSGYSQIIGPLVPYKLNEWNQKLGIETYENILGFKPKIILVNEMAFSSSMINLYDKFGYKAFIMDRDNIKLILNSNKETNKKYPTHGYGVNGCEMQVLWSDSILFQKLQHFAHGDISVADYLCYLNNRLKEGEYIFPIYCNDAEVFDFRPGRFAEERPTHPDGEWNRIEKLLKLVVNETKMNFVLPSVVLKIINSSTEKYVTDFVNASYPVPVKKQNKYNLLRWAVTGRNDLWLNTMCFRIEKHLSENKNNDPHIWQELCELWQSDLRTHITKKRWQKALRKLNKILKQEGIDNSFKNKNILNEKFKNISSVLGLIDDTGITLENDGILLSISSKKINLKLNLRRGLTIEAISFYSHDMVPCIGKLPHGHFTSIELGADYYSGGVIIELPLSRSRVTDLDRVKPRILKKKNGNIKILADIVTPFGNVIKIIEVFSDQEKVEISYHFSNWKKILGSVRLGIMTFLNHFCDKNTKLFCTNGGDDYECFDLNGYICHAKPASTLVSSSRGFGATSGKIIVSNNNRNLKFIWDPSESAVIPMLHNETVNKKTLSRLIFSMKETDDTVKGASELCSFKLVIST